MKRPILKLKLPRWLPEGQPGFAPATSKYKATMSLKVWRHKEQRWYDLGEANDVYMTVSEDK